MAKRAFGLMVPVRKFAALLAAIVGVAVLATSSVALLAPWVFSTLALRTEIAARFRDTTGLEMVARAEPVFALWPRPHVALSDVGFADPSGALRVEARYLEGYLRVASLLTGRIEVSRVRLAQPELYIDVDGRPMPPHSAIGRAATAKSTTLQASSTDEVRLGAVEIVDGTAHIVSGAGQHEVTIGAIDVTVDWPKLGAAAQVRGHLVWNGERAAIDATIGRPVGLIRGEPSGLGLQIAAPAGSLAFEGLLETQPSARLTGRLEVASASASRALAVARATSYLPTPFENVRLDCTATISERGVDCSDIRLHLDGNDLRGALSLRTTEDRLAVSGALATEVLSLRPVLARLPAAIGRDGQWSRINFDIRQDRVPDMDLRLAAVRVELGATRLESAKLSVHSERGTIALDLPNATAVGGSIAGHALVGVRDGEIDLHLETKFSDVGLSASTRGSVGNWRIAGSTTGAANLVTKGASTSDLMRNIEGTAEITLASGEFAGIDLDRAFYRLDKRPLSLGEAIHHGATAFEAARFSLGIHKGVATIEKGILRTVLVDLAVGGTADIAERSLDLRAVATPGAGVQSSIAPESRNFRFDVAGSFDDPLFLPDVRSLIRRSGAAAPLLGRGP